MKIKDPIHGYIELGEEEEQILNTPELQRLRNIKQLGFANLVYPSANHTRFEHTLGVLSVAQQYADSLDLDNERTKELRLAALYHDAGHGPWSHLSEEITGQDHEQLSCDIVDNHEDKFEADADRIKKIIKGELEIGQVIHGGVDADRMDYLQRDAYMTGVDHGTIDSETIIENAELNNRRLIYDYKAIQSLESLLVAREHMMKSVYKHHTSRIADKMVKYTANNSSTNIDMSMDDHQAREELKFKGIFNRVANRDLYKRAGRIDEDPSVIKNKVLSETNLNEEDVLVDRQENEGGKPVDIKVKYYDQIKQLSEVSSIPEALREEQNSLTHVYASKENLKNVRQTLWENFE